MTSYPRATVQVIWEGQSPTVMALIDDQAGELLTPAGVASIAYQIFDLGDEATQVDADTIDKNTAVLSSPVVDARWTGGPPGYNFRWRVPGDKLAEGDHTYRVEILIIAAGTPADVTPLVFEFPTLDLLSLPPEEPT